MQYLCLVYQEEDKINTLPANEYDALICNEQHYAEEFRASGHILSCGFLQSVDAATAIRVRNANVFVMDGPVAESEEQLGSYYLIEARDLNEAIRLASRMPSAQLGSIEIRPVMDRPEPCGDGYGVPSPAMVPRDGGIQ